MNEFIFPVADIFNSETRTGCLQQHGCGAFYIPPYQRGYKWGSEINQPVDRLLSDLYKAWSNGEKEYLLQAITVKKIQKEQASFVLEVIDGQQRLTTLFILLHVLHSRIKSPNTNPAASKLRYEIRHKETSLDDLVAAWVKEAEANIGNTKATFNDLKATLKVETEQRQDCYFLKCAALRCVHELGKKEYVSEKEDVSESGNAHTVDNFLDFLLTKTKLMVNAVEHHIKGEVLFGNLNSNRVVLTETELIKGLLLTRVAREAPTTRTRRYREVLEMRIHLGRKWGDLDRWANRPEIRSLYFPHFEDGMRGLLELVAMQMERDPYIRSGKDGIDTKPLFEYYLKQKHWESIFSLLANTHATLDEWFLRTEDYHLLGYCLIHKDNAARLAFLAKHLRLKTKPEVRTSLLIKRNSILNPKEAAECTNAEDLVYGDDDKRIQSILLALSVFRGQEAAGRFDFHAYEDEKWSLEHIFPQTPFGKDAKLNDKQINEAFGILCTKSKAVISEELVQQLEGLKEQHEHPDFKKLVDDFLEKVPLLHQIGNLCLLSGRDNSAMGCGMFSEKRAVIQNRIAQGSFVPRHTYEVFGKMINGMKPDLEVWSKDDINAHKAEISARVKTLLEEKAQ